MTESNTEANKTNTEVNKEEVENPVLHFWTQHHGIWVKAREYAMNLKRIDADAS